MIGPVVKLKIYNPFLSNRQVWKHRETRIISKGTEDVQGHSEDRRRDRIRKEEREMLRSRSRRGGGGAGSPGFGNSACGLLEVRGLLEAHPVLTDLRPSSNKGNDKLGYCSLG